MLCFTLLSYGLKELIINAYKSTQKTIIMYYTINYLWHMTVDARMSLLNKKQSGSHTISLPLSNLNSLYSAPYFYLNDSTLSTWKFLISLTDTKIGNTIITTKKNTEITYENFSVAVAVLWETIFMRQLITNIEYASVNVTNI